MEAAKSKIAIKGAAAAAAQGAAEVAVGGAQAGGLFARLRNRFGQSAAQLANPAARGLLTSAFAGEEEEEGPAQVRAGGARAGRGGRGRVGPEDAKPLAAADGSFAVPLAAPGEGRTSVARGGAAIPAGVLKGRSMGKAGADDMFALAQPKELPEFKPKPVPHAQPSAKTGVKLDLVRAPTGQRRSSTAAVVGSPHGGGAGGGGAGGPGGGSVPNTAVFQTLQPVGSGAISGRYSANMPSPTIQNRPSGTAASPLQGNKQSGAGNTQQKL